MDDKEKAESPLQKPESPLQKSELPLPPPPPLCTTTDTEDPIPKKKKPQTCCKCFKIFCCVLFIIILALIGVFLFFVFYIFKKRGVEVAASSATLETFSYTITPITLNLVMGVNIDIKNPNYAGYKYQNSNTTIFYHGIPAGFAPMPAGVVKSRSKKKLHTTVYMNATTMINTPFLLQELIMGKIPLQSKTFLTGKITLFDKIKIHATVLTTCDITVDIASMTSSASCKGDVKIF